MTELKTLKDIELWECEACGSNIMSRDDLKAEAVKWVKDRMKVKNGLSLITETSKLRAEGMINDFIDFFNLTKEDLKEVVGENNK